MTDKITDVLSLEKLKGLSVIQKEVYIPHAGRKLTFSDLGLSKDQIPPKKVVSSMGSKNIIDPQKLNDLHASHRRFERLVEQHSVGTMKLRLVPDAELASLCAELDAECALFEKAATAFFRNLDVLVDEWVFQLEEPWATMVRSAVKNGRFIRNKPSLTYTIFKIAPGGVQDTRLAGAIGGIGSKIESEVAQMAREVFETSFKGKTAVRLSAVSGINRIAGKLSSLAFLDPKVGELKDRVEKVLGNLPKKGPLKGIELDLLNGLLVTLAGIGELANEESSDDLFEEDVAETVEVAKSPVSVEVYGTSNDLFGDYQLEDEGIAHFDGMMMDDTPEMPPVTVGNWG